MAKEKYTFNAELDIGNVLSNSKKAQREVREIGNIARETSKQAKITGSLTMKNKGIQETQKALKIAKDNVNQLTDALNQAKLNGGTTKQIEGLESQLRKAQTSALKLENDLSQIDGGKVGNSLQNAGKKASGFGSTMLSVGSKVGNIISGIAAGWGIVAGAVTKAAGVVKGFAGTLIDTYDTQVQSQKTLTATLSDGAKGYKDFNSGIEKGNALVKSQKNDLNELGATISSYTQMTGKSAFDTVNAINSIGDSLSVSMEGQKQFTLGLAQAMGSGTLHAQDFNQMMQTALGASFKQMLIDAGNEVGKWGHITQANFKDAMEDGVFSTNVMNLALQKFQEKGQQTASSGASTFGQIKEMVKQGFNTSALTGFQSGLGKTGVKMSTMGNEATRMSSLVGQELGQMAGKAVHSLTLMIDKNGDGVVSNKEFKEASDKAMKTVGKFFDKVGSAVKPFAQFGGAIGKVLGGIMDFIGGIKDAYNALDNFLNKANDALGLGSKKSSGGGFFSGGIFDNNWSLFSMPYDDSTLGKNLDKYFVGNDFDFVRDGAMPIATYAAQVDLPPAPSFNAAASITSGSSTSTTTQNMGGVSIEVSGVNDPNRLAKQIYSRLERNGIKLPRR